MSSQALINDIGRTTVSLIMHSLIFFFFFYLADIEKDSSQHILDLVVREKYEHRLPTTWEFGGGSCADRFSRGDGHPPKFCTDP